MSRLAATFERLRAAGRPGLVTYVTAGDPDLPRTEGILRALDRAGADVVEIGIPFSDPLADGPVIQRATERALAAGTTLIGVLDLLRRVRADLSMPVVVSLWTHTTWVMAASWVSAASSRSRSGGASSPES